MSFYTILLGFYYDTSQLLTFLHGIAESMLPFQFELNWTELSVNVLTFSFANGQYTSITNRKIAI